jgi:hypothetical protein
MKSALIKDQGTGWYLSELRGLRMLGLTQIDVHHGSNGIVGNATKPMLKGKSARWLLDDAFRQSEIASISAWQSLAGVKIDEIIPIGKGLATGRLNAVNRSG